MLLFAFFTNRGTPATGLTPIIDIWETDGTQVVTAQAMVVVSGGWYSYNFTTYDDAKNYATRADGGSGLPSLDRYKAATNESLSAAEYVWDVQESAHTVVGSFGLGVSNILTDTNVTIPALIAALNDLSQIDVQTAMTTQGYTTARAVLLNFLDVATSSRSSHTPSDVTTDMDANSVDLDAIQALIAALNNLSVADITTQLAVEHGAGSWTSADITALALEATVQAIKAKTDAIPVNPAPAAEYDVRMATIQADLDDPIQYQADISSLALEATADLIRKLLTNRQELQAGSSNNFITYDDDDSVLLTQNVTDDSGSAIVIEPGNPARRSKGV